MPFSTLASRLSHHVGRHLQPDVWAGASTVLALLGTATAAIGWMVVTVVLVLLAIGCLVAKAAASKRRGRRSARAAAAALVDLDPSTVLYRAGQSLDLSARFPGWRLSLYSLEPATGMWRLVGRAAANVSLEGPGVSSPLSIGQGILAAPLRRSDSLVNVADVSPLLPDRMLSAREWMDAQRAWGLTLKRAASMRMSSRAYWGQVYRFEQAGRDGTVLGLVLESDGDRPIGRGSLEDSFSRPFFETLNMLINAKTQLTQVTTGGR